MSHALGAREAVVERLLDAIACCVLLILEARAFVDAEASFVAFRRRAVVERGADRDRITDRAKDFFHVLLAAALPDRDLVLWDLANDRCVVLGLGRAGRRGFFRQLRELDR